MNLNSSLLLRSATASVSALALIGALGSAAFADTGDAKRIENQIVEVSIPGQPLAPALAAFMMQTNVMVVAPASMTEGRMSTAVSGAQPPAKALRAILQGTNLDVREGRDGAYVLVQRMAQPEESPPQQTSPGEIDPEIAADTIVVTGTNIRGVETPSPMLSFDRQDIESAGLSTVQDFIETLPQNFNGAVSAGVFTTPTDQLVRSNIAQGTSINLRGLGGGGTLTLLDGRRVAPAGATGGFVDVSLIPLSAISRVEIVPDGSSAIYGADAVGGVANFIILDDFGGAETTLRYGFATEGGADEYRASQTFGKTWGAGAALLAYEFFSQDEVTVGQRDFAQGPGFDFDLLPEQERHSVLGKIRHELAPDLEISAHALYASRDTDYRTDFNFFTRDTVGTTEQLDLSGAISYEFVGNWQLYVRGGYSRNELESSNFNPDASNSVTSMIESESQLASVDAIASGPIIDLPGGSVDLAIGGAFRSEDLFVFDVANDVTDVDLNREVYAAFAEINIPVFSADQDIPFIDELVINAAVRHEDYSDFGSTTNPKVGVIWSPTEGVRIRGTYSTSFSAPVLGDLSEATNTVGIGLIPDARSTTGFSTILSIGGGNRGLGPSEARTFTAGVDFEPVQIPGLQLNATYYNIEFEDRVGAAFTTIVEAITNEDALQGFGVFRDPDDAFVQMLFDIGANNGGVFNFGGPDPFDPALIDLVFDIRQNNLAVTNTSGIDLQAAYKIDTDIGRLDFSANGNYILELENAATPAALPVDNVGEIYNPSELRLRVGAGWSNDVLSINSFVNHVSAGDDTRFDPITDISAFTTADFRILYDLSSASESSFLQGASFAINIVNAFNEEPPAVVPDTLFNFLPYDATNATPLGRFMSFELRKSW